MTTIHDAANPVSKVRSSPRILRYISELKNAIERRRRCRSVRANLADLSDRELFDMGITRGEIDYVAVHHSLDPRGMRSDGVMSR